MVLCLGHGRPQLPGLQELGHQDAEAVLVRELGYEDRSPSALVVHYNLQSPLSPSGHGHRSMSWSWVPSFFPVPSCTAKLRHPQASKESGKLFTATWQVTNRLGQGRT